MGWKERIQGKLGELSTKSQPKADQLRQDAPELLAKLRNRTERGGNSVKSMMDDIAQSFREGANGDDGPAAPPKADEPPTESPPPR